MDPRDIRVDIGRLRGDIEELGAIGRAPRGGVSRPSFSPADLEARRWLKDRIQAAGLAYSQDGAGNQFGRLGTAKGPAVMAGSHLDTVVNGGIFDGAAGVLAALECLRCAREAGLSPAKPLLLASFTDEEGHLVGDFLGSRAFAGRLDAEAVRRGHTASGATLAEALRGTEFTVEGVLEAYRDRPELAAYLELHIEQGPVLETEGLPIGVVETIAGKRYYLASFIGRPDHAGTTPLELRQDAFLALADFTLRATRHVAAEHYGSMITVGKVALHPGAFSVVAGRADFTLDFRSAVPATLAAMDKEIRDIAEDVASTRGVKFAAKLADATEPLAIPERLLALLETESERLGYPRMHITSGAGHDAQILSAVCESGMIFIPCLDGISHAPEESVSYEDLEKGANLLLAALLELAG